MARAITLALIVWAWASAARAQARPSYLRDYCIKVKEGRDAELATRLSQVDGGGGPSFWAAQQAVVPQGSEARCDYHLVFGYPAFPPETTAAEAVAKGSALHTLVNVEIWRVEESVGAFGTPGGYLRRNTHEPKQGQLRQWLLHQDPWKAFADAYAKENAGGGWAVMTLAMPGGESVPYHGLTLDVFPSWEALGRGMGIATRWPKVHPELPFADYLASGREVSERSSEEVFRIVQLARH